VLIAVRQDAAVNFDLLRSWLGLPPGSWPPDHYTLLGFAPAHADAAAVEPRVLQKMNLVRRHQLLHPELVTEGMNRLAQALITLTDPIEKAAYDAELGVAEIPVVSLPLPPRHTPSPDLDPGPVIVAEPVLDDDDEPLELEEEVEVHPTELTQEILLPAELIQPYEVVQEPKSVPFQEPERPKPIERVVEAVPVVRPWPTPPSSRRWIYARLAVIRKSRRAWDRLRHVFLDPQDPLDRPGRVLLLLEGAAAVRPHLPSLLGVVGSVNEPGGLIASVLKQPLLLDTIRRLLPEQREALAQDWRRGQMELEREYNRLRTLAVEERSKAEGIQRLPAVVRWLRDVPELVLIGFAFFILFIALIRSLLGGNSP